MSWQIKEDHEIEDECPVCGQEIGVSVDLDYALRREMIDHLKEEHTIREKISAGIRTKFGEIRERQK